MDWKEEKKTQAIDWDGSGELFGRTEQIDSLKREYDSMRKGKCSKPKCVLLTGLSGTGKSALARSMRSRVEDDWGFFLFGKFDNNQAPHAAFIGAAEEFVRQVQLRGDFVMETIRESVKEAIGPEIFLLLEVIPLLEDILKSNNSSLLGSSLNSLNFDLETSNSSDSDSFRMPGGDANQNNARFMSVFCRFIRAICSSERPMVLLLDDLQWADDASLQILRTLLDPSSDAIEGLMIIGTCRGNEVTLGDELSVVIRDLEDRGTIITDIQVSNLDVAALSNMISNALDLPVKDCTPLAEIVHSQTCGNAFFTQQYLKSSLEDGVLCKDANDRWTWDENALILNLHAGDSSNDDVIIQLLAKKLQQMPQVVVDTMKTIACMGSKFSETILFHAGTVVQSGVLLALETAAEHGFIAYDVDLGAGHFLHDKFREAAYSLIPDEERPMFHLTLGRSLRRQLSIAQVKANIVLIVNQIKHGLDHVEGEDEREDCARLFLRASREVAKSSAFRAALDYIDLGIEMLSRRKWRDQYELALDLFSTGSELGYCTGLHDKVDAFTAEVVANARSTEETIRVNSTQVLSLSGRGDVGAGMSLCLDTLKKLGEPYPRTCGICRILWELYLTKRALRGKTEEDILRLPRIEDPRIISSMQMIYVLFPLVAVSNIGSAPLPAFRLVRLTLKHGLSPLAGIAFDIYAGSLVRLGEYDEAHRWAHLANVILNRYRSRQLHAKVKFVFWATVQTIHVPHRDILKPVWDSFRIGMKTGDIEISLAACTFHEVFRIYLGDPLPEILKSLLKSEGLCLAYNQMKLVGLTGCAQQLCHNLQGFAKEPLVLTGQYCDEEKDMRRLRAQNLTTAVSVIVHFKFMLAAVLNENEYAESVFKANPDCFGFQLMPFLTIHHYLHRGVVSAALARSSAGRVRRRRRYIADAQRNIEKLKTLLIHCPDNIIPKIQLIEAELEFCKGRFSTALIHYRKSISYAQRARFITEQALACEKAGIMLQQADRPAEANDYLQQARSLYKSWGAEIKVGQMDKLLKL